MLLDFSVRLDKYFFDKEVSPQKPAEAGFCGDKIAKAHNTHCQVLPYYCEQGYNCHYYMDALARLFCSPARLKLLRLFMFNDMAYSAKEVVFRAKVATPAVRKELSALIAMGVIRRKGQGREVKYCADRRFPYSKALVNFLRDTTIVDSQEVISVLRKAGGMLRLVVLTGIFSDSIESKIDLLIVGDRLDEHSIVSAVRIIEADIGREIRYTVFSTEDFRYRFGVYDRLLRDIFDYAHQVILDKIGV